MADCSGHAPMPDMTALVRAMDNCGSVLVTQSPRAGTLLPVGHYSVVLTAADQSGNFSACTAGFDVIADSCPEDVFPTRAGDGQVGPGDLAQLLGKWGECDGCCEDLAPIAAPDGIVGPADLAQLLSHWGPCAAADAPSAEPGRRLRMPFAVRALGQ